MFLHAGFYSTIESLLDAVEIEETVKYRQVSFLKSVQTIFHARFTTKLESICSFFNVFSFSLLI